MTSLPRLSVVMFTDGPMPQVAATLGHAREVADEIVVAVDERVPADQLGWLGGVADRVVRAEFVRPLEANLAWLHSQASGDWVLRLDSDDVLSAALVRRLQTPGWDEGITHAYLQYRWLWGDPHTMIEHPPWWPDPVLRLVRNLPGIARFEPLAHHVPDVAGGGQFWDEALYHLDLLVTPTSRRRAKALAYELDAPGLRTDRGWAVSATYYRPDDMSPPPRTAAVPSVDAAVVARVAQAATSQAPAPSVELPHLSGPVRAADRAPSAPTPGDLRLRVLGHDPIAAIAPRPTVVTVGVTNLGAGPWLPEHDPAHRLGARMIDAAGAQVGPELRSPFDGPVPVGREVLGRLQVPGDLPPTATHLDIGVVQDGVAWHDAVQRIALHQQRGRRVLVSAGVSVFPHLGDDLIARAVLAAIAVELPDVVPVMLAHPTGTLADRFGCEVAQGPAALGSGPRSADQRRRTRELVTQARLMAKGEAPEDPLVADLLRPFAQASALVIAPGGGLASRFSREALGVYAVQAQIARAFELPVVIEAGSIGPIEVRRDQATLAHLFDEAASVTTRDAGSADAARRIGRAVDVRVVPDPATASVAHIDADRARVESWLRAHDIDPDGPYAVVSLRAGTDDGRHWPTVDAALDALPPGTSAVYLPHCNDPGTLDDRALLDDRSAPRPSLVAWDLPIDDRAPVALVAGAAIAVGSRFHLSVLAAAAGVPSVALVAGPYDTVRIRSVEGSSGVRVVDLDDPAGAAAATAALMEGSRPDPVEHWDPKRFTGELAALLPAAPRLR